MYGIDEKPEEDRETLFSAVKSFFADIMEIKNTIEIIDA